MRPRRRTLAAVTILAAVLAAAAAVWLLAIRPRTEPVPIGEAVTTFRAAPAGGATAAGLPRAGVYVYATTGSEQVDALTGETHRYPARTAVTVAGTACGFVETWSPIRGRSAAATTCRAGGGLAQRRLVDRHTFLGVAATRAYRCTPTSWELPPRPRPRLAWAGRCVSKEIRTASRGRVIGLERVVVGGRTVAAVHLRTAYRQAGESRGGGVRDVWRRRPDGLLLRVRAGEEDVTGSPVGDVTYTERYSLALTGLTPRR